MVDLVLVALVVLPAVVGAALLLAGPVADRYAGGASVGAAALVALASVPLACPPGGVRAAVASPFLVGSDLGLAVDGLAAPVLPVVALVSLLVLVSAGGSADLRTARFHGLMLLFVAAALMTVLATSLPALLLSWEVMGATSYALIGYHWRDPAAVASGTTAFLITRAADLGLYVAAGAALAGGAGLGLSTLAETSAGWRHVLAAGLVVAGLGKAAQLPFSFWLSRAMHGPSPVSALLHSAAMVALGGYLLLRVSPTLAATGWADDATAWAGATTAVVLGLVALAQSDLKQLLAASTAAQLAFVVLAAGLGVTAAGTMHLVAHAAVKAGLFLAAGLWLEALGTKRLASLSGAVWRWPVVGACAAAGLVSLAGLPPFALWATKDAVLSGALEHSPLLYATGLVGAALAAAYSGKALVVLGRRDQQGVEEGVEAGWDEERPGTRQVPTRATVTLVPLAVGALALGVLALPSVAGPLHDLVGGAAAEPARLELLFSALVALIALGLTLLLVRRGRLTAEAAGPALLADWLHLERVTQRVVVAPTLRLAELLARVDDGLLDPVVDGVGRGSLRAAEGAARVDDTVVEGAVRRVVAGTRGLGRVLQRPQTGQLHQYYLQALAVLALAVVVLVVVR